MAWFLLGTLLSGGLVAWVTGFAVRRWAGAWGLVDRPGARKVHARPTPLGGGLAIWLGVMVPLGLGQLVLWGVLAGRQPESPWRWLAELPWPGIVATHWDGLAQQSPLLWTFLGLGTVLVALGLADDRGGLDWRLRLGVEAGVALALVACGWRLAWFERWPWAAWPVSVLWIVALVNSFNMLDNMDWLSGGVAWVASAALAAVLLVAPDPVTRGPQLFVAGFLLLLVGSLSGFLWHNRPPARLFMGDAGAYFLGFSLAAMTMAATFAGGSLPEHAVLAPLCILAVPLYDLVSVVTIRLRQGRSPFQADKSHFSHRLVELGLSKVQAVLTIHLATATTCLGAVLLYQVDRLGAVAVLSLVGCVLGLVAILELAGQRARRQPAPDDTPPRNPPP